MSEHNPDCDVNDINPDGIKKPCNCGARADKLDALCVEMLDAIRRGDDEASKRADEWEKRREEA